MCKKLVCQLLLFFLLFNTWLDIRNLKPMETIRITNPRPIFPRIQIDLLQSKDIALVNDALHQTAQSLLQYLDPDYSKEPWQAEHSFLNLIPGEELELIITLSLPPDRGIICVLEKQNNNYILLHYTNEVLPLGKLAKLSMGFKQDLFITREDHQERIGSFSESRRVRIWGWQESGLKIVWEELSYWEMHWLNTWQNPQEPLSKWLKLSQNFHITYQIENNPVIKVEGEQIYAQAPAANETTLPDPLNFQVLKTRVINKQYFWNEKWQRFILGTGRDEQNSGNKVAILKDLSHNLEFLAVSQQEAKFEVIDEQGRILQVPKKNITLD